MRRLRATSLTEAVTASALFMIVFAVSLEMLPKLTSGDTDAARHIEVRNMTENARRKYAAGLWPSGYYVERTERATAEIEITPYRDFEDVATLRITAVSGNVKTVHTQLVRCDRTE